VSTRFDSLDRVLQSELRQEQLGPARIAAERDEQHRARSESRAADRRLVQPGQSGGAGLRDRLGPVDVPAKRGRLRAVAHGRRLSVLRGRTDASQRRRLPVHKGTR